MSVAESEVEERVLLSYRDVAVMLGTSQRTIRREVQRGRLSRPKKVRGCVRFLKSDVDAYVGKLREQ